MISKKNFDKVIANLNNSNLVKTKLSKINFSEIYLNKTSGSKKIINNEKLSFADKVSIFNFSEKDWGQLCDGYEKEFNLENINNNYEIFPEKEFSKYKNFDEFDEDYDLYILKNEYFGFDSYKINIFDNYDISNIEYPFFDTQYYLDKVKQTLILVKNKPVNSKAQFFFKNSEYWSVVYGEFDSTQNLYASKIEKFIKKIFGWPIINYNNDSIIFKSNEWKNNFANIEILFNKFVKENNLKQINFLKLKRNYCRKISEDFIDNDFLFNLSKINTDSTIKEQNYYHKKGWKYIKLNFTKPFYAFWNDENSKYLKYFVLTKKYLEIENLFQKNEKHLKNNYKINDLYDSEVEHVNYYENSKEFAFKENIIISKIIDWPILIWDQRNFQKPYYKIIIPANVSRFYDDKNKAIFYEKLFSKIREINQKFNWFLNR
ncbi:hypothetical protein ACW95P_03390 [Candidatus Mycoplasma pogonae]